MRGEVDDSGNQPAFGKRGKAERDRLDDDRRVHRRCRRTLMTELADGTHGRQVGFRVRVAGFDGRGDEQRNDDGDSNRRTDAPLRSSWTDQVDHASLSLAAADCRTGLAGPVPTRMLRRAGWPVKPGEPVNWLLM